MHEYVTKKIVCFSLVIIMLMSNLIAPIKAIAKEINIIAEIKSASNGASATSQMVTDAKSTNDEDVSLKLRPATEDTVTEKKKNDAWEIETFQMQFVSGAKEDDGNLVWTPENSSKGHELITGMKDLNIIGIMQITN